MALPPAAPHSTCLVTGASAGMGVELARALAARGRGVTLVARREDRLRALAAELGEAHGVRVEAIACDVGDDGERRRLASEVEARELVVDVLVNNAGIGSAGRFQSLDPEREIAMVRVNVEAVVALCGAYVPAMVARGAGAVLNVASTSAYQPLPRQATYAASKAFVLSFTEALNSDLHSTAVAATALCPGPVRTEFFDAASIEDAFEGTPDFVWTSAEEVARAGVEGLAEGRRVVVPGAANKVSAIGGRLAPRGPLLAVLRRGYPMGR
jgi:uncharacterized protein